MRAKLVKIGDGFVRLGRNGKVKAAVLASALVAPSFAQDATGPMASLETLTTNLGELNTKASAIMVALATLTLTIVIGVIVMKLTKKGQRGG